MSSTLRKPPGSLTTMPKFRKFRDDRPDVETMNPGSSKARHEGCSCSPVANNYGSGPHFAPDPSCRLHGGELLPPIEPGQLRCQRCARGIDGRGRFCDMCRYVLIRTRCTTPEFREKMRQISAGGRHWNLQPRACPCGIEFTPNAPPQKYHAVDCPARPPKNDHRRKKDPGAPRVYRPRRCIDCGELFTPVGPRHTHCGCAEREATALRTREAAA